MRGADRLSRFVDALLRNRRPRRFSASPEELGAMRAAAALRAARPGADLPDPAFVEQLGRRLRLALEPEPDRRRLSRRRLLLGAGTAAAAAAAGGVAGVVGDRLAAGLAQSPELVPANATWTPVMAASAVPAGQAVRFTTGAIEGFVVNRGGRLRAVSAVCTHLGCILQAAGSGRLMCPCHRTAFSTGGDVLYHELPQAPAPLPTLRTRVRDGVVEVLAT